MTPVTLPSICSCTTNGTQLSGALVRLSPLSANFFLKMPWILSNVTVHPPKDSVLTVLVCVLFDMMLYALRQ